MPLFCAGGISTPADASLVLQLGAEAVFVGSGIFKSEDPVRMAQAIVEATTHFRDAGVVAKVSTGLGAAMRGAETRTARAASGRARLVVPRVGVLALQGDVREHSAMLRRGRRRGGGRSQAPSTSTASTAWCCPAASPRRSPISGDLGHRARRSKRGCTNGLRVLGTCAGLILLSSEILDGRSDQWSFAALDVAVRRNGYGRQIASFETIVEVQGIGAVPGVFIRAPKIETWSSDLEVLATHDHGDGDHPVLVRHGAVWGCSFHPELTSDDRLHRLFVESL